MPVQINITDKDMSYAEDILLSESHHFDDERRNFIKNLETIDLQAVPGSGKTTVLLAKLLILEKHLPFEDGSGVLIISHTNAAVDEIKNRIAKFCPKLFSYPNFVGTIQSFVDLFLAIPCGNNALGTHISWIDTAKYESNILTKFKRIYWSTKYDKPGTLFWGRHIDRAKKEAKQSQKSEADICNEHIEKEIKLLFYDYCDEKIKRIDNKKVILSDKTNKKFDGLKTIITESVSEGIISYEYAFNIANFYLKKYPQIKNLLQHRFRYVFVDEMQDMDKHQYDLLENIFYNNGNSLSSYQRIGDKNQAIFNGSAKLDDIWEKRKTVLKMKGSYRLTDKIANIVKYFGLDFIDIEGRNRNSNDSEIKPHVIVFDEQSKQNVIPKFAKLIIQLQSENKIPQNPEYPCKAIAWRKDKLENGKLGLNNYWDNFKDNHHKPKEDYSCLESYLFYYDRNKGTLESIRKNILNALLRILRYENVFDDKEKIYTKRKLLSALKERNDDEYENFKLLLYQWSMGIIKGKKDTVLSELIDYIPEFLDIFGKSINECKDFIEKSEIDEQIPATSDHTCSTKNNIFEKSGIKIEVTTIHSAKGQTHTATLYMESYYYQDGKGENAKSYESQRLLEQIKGNKIEKMNDRGKQSAKMIYVGFSRPTHLLCFAVHKDRFEKNDFKDNWELTDITESTSAVVASAVETGKY